MTKNLIERERAELKARMAKINALANVPTRVAIMTHPELTRLLEEISKLSEGLAER